MFTVKFIPDHKDESAQQSKKTSIRCPNYEANTFERRWTILTYPGMTSDYGIKHHVTKDDNLSGYDACFVENAEGKMVDAYRA